MNLEIADAIIDLGRRYYQRGWVYGTSGNFSAVEGRDPLRLVITRSGADKGALDRDLLVEVDENGAVVGGTGKPSDETPVHLTLVSRAGAGAVLHTHSVWSTLLSEVHLNAGTLTLRGWEMLKGLRGVTTHQTEIELPILENTQDYAALARAIGERLQTGPTAPGLLLAGHGLYAWGADLPEANRHLEVLEFLLEVVGRRDYRRPG